MNTVTALLEYLDLVCYFIERGGEEGQACPLRPPPDPPLYCIYVCIIIFIIIDGSLLLRAYSRFIHALSSLQVQYGTRYGSIIIRDHGSFALSRKKILT